MTESPPRILADIRDEASSIAAEMTAAGLPVRLLGGVAFWLRCPSVRSEPFARDYADLDFAVGKTASQPFRARPVAKARSNLPHQPQSPRKAPLQNQWLWRSTEPIG